jgi:pimeloyl-ACP methyl ester carboxylesterase
MPRQPVVGARNRGGCKLPFEPPPPEGVRTIDVTQVPRPDGARLQVQVSGSPDAPVLVLLQGQASSHDWWTDLRGRYEDRFRTITLDYRGTGLTVTPAGGLSTELLADDAIAVLDFLGIAIAHVYGTSMGGRVAQMAAARHPSRVKSLVLACTSPGGTHAVERSDAIRRALADPDETSRRATLVGLFYTPAWGDDPARSRLFGDPTMSAEDRQRHLRMSARHDAWDLLPDIVCPTLVLHGSDDQMTPTVNAPAIAGRLPDAQLHVHAGGRHGFFDEFADELEETMSAFWTSHA